MICDNCKLESGPLSYDIEYDGCLCDKCRRALKMEIKPRPCPFCGLRHFSDVVGSGSVSNFVYYVQCENCGARGPLSPTYNDAVSDWNIPARGKE